MPVTRVPRLVLRRLASTARPGGSRDVEDSRMTLTDHLVELRRRLLWSIVAVGVATLVVGVWAYDPILTLLRHPYCQQPARLTLGGHCQLVFLHPTDAFFVRLKVALIGGVVAASPFWLYQLWAFITPGLHRHERRYALSFVLSSVLLFAAGLTVAYLVLPQALKVLLGIGGDGVTALLGISEYVSFITTLLLIFGVSFEFPLLVVMLNIAGVLTAVRLRAWRRVSYFLLFAFAAAATPTQDPYTMLFLALPLCVLFEASVVFARLHDRAKARRDARSAYAGLADDETSELDLDDREERLGRRAGPADDAAGHPEPRDYSDIS